MISMAVVVAFFAVAAAVLLNLYRVARGPDLPDRILGLDTMIYNAIALLMLAGIRFDQGDAYFAAALVIAMLGFISTVALCSYLLRGEVIE